MPITVHEIGPDGQLVQTTIGDDPSSTAAPAAPAVDPPGDSAPPADAPPAAPAPGEEAPPDSAPDVPETPETPETPEDEDEEPVALTRGAQRRIDRLIKQREDARRAQAALEERLRMLEQGYTRPEPEAPAAPPEPPSARREDFANDEEWIQAVTQQAIAREREHWQLEQLRMRHDQERQQRDAQWQTREQTFRQQHPDYEDQIRQLQGRIAPHLWEGLTESELAPDLAYHLARHPDELQRLNTLQPMALSRALGRLEQQLQAPAPRPASPTPKPAPPTPLNGAGHTGPRLLSELSDADIEQMSLAEFDAAYKRQFGRVR